MKTACVIVTSLAACASFAQATTFGFAAITTNSVSNPAIGASQLSVDVTPISASTVSFKFQNTGAAACSITDIYFQAPGYLSALTIGSMSSGVSFGIGASPANLPAGNSISPNFTASLSADSNAPTQPNGVNPGEWLELVGHLQSGVTFVDAMTAMNTSQLRVGLHVQGFANGGSESFVNTVPSPGAAALAACGLVLCRRRRHVKA